MHRNRKKYVMTCYFFILCGWLCNELTEPFDVTLSHGFSSFALCRNGRLIDGTRSVRNLWWADLDEDHDEFVNTTAMGVRRCHAEWQIDYLSASLYVPFICLFLNSSPPRSSTSIQSILSATFQGPRPIFWRPSRRLSVSVNESLWVSHNVNIELLLQLQSRGLWGLRERVPLHKK